jgi:hypothetical protein
MTEKIIGYFKKNYDFFTDIVNTQYNDYPDIVHNPIDINSIEVFYFNIG